MLGNRIFIGMIPQRGFCLFALITFGCYVYFSINKELLLTKFNQRDWEIERRIQDWNWKSTPEENFCRAAYTEDVHANKEPIPNIVHFVFLAEEGKEAELNYGRFLAIKAAIVRLNASQIKLHTYSLNTTNPWWQKLSKHVTLVTLNRSTIYAPYDHLIGQIDLPHQADIIRLAILLREGGIYLDTDVYALKPFSDLLRNPRDTIMGHEGGNRYGLCNAAIASRPQSEFLRKWQGTYKTLDPKTWNEHSVLKPKQLQVQFPNLICPLSPAVFFWPTWAKAHKRYMHGTISAADVAELRANMTAHGGAMYADQLAIHAWGAHGMPTLTAEGIARDDTRFNMLLREVAAATL